MRIEREYFGVDRTTVTYEGDIHGVGGNADGCFVVAEVTRNGAIAARAVVRFSHEEMAHLLADYRQNHPIEGSCMQPLLPGPVPSRARRAWRTIRGLIGL
jgi:hypothetical protein